MIEAIDAVAVIGAGRMGHGIAFAYALSGRDVALFDVDDAALAAAREAIDAAATTFVEAGRLSEREADAATGRIAYRESLPAAVDGADLVTEAVTEDAAIKGETFAALDEHAPPGAILASNTSGLSITDLAGAVDDPGRVLGTHWFNPPHIVPLVEVVRGDETRDAPVETVYGALDAMGKTPVEVEQDIPGFIGNRLQFAMAYEALSLLERGVASPEAIDRAVSAGFGFRLPVLGILEKIDHSGLDVHHDVEEYLLPELDRGTEPSGILTDLVAEGHDGLASGRGIYEWDRPAEAVYAERDRDLLALLDAYERASGDGPGPSSDR